MMFDLDGLDIQTIKDALICYDGDLRKKLNFYKSNSVQCPFLVENRLERITRVMKKITSTRKGEKDYDV